MRRPQAVLEGGLGPRRVTRPTAAPTRPLTRHRVALLLCGPSDLVIACERRVQRYISNGSSSRHGDKFAPLKVSPRRWQRKPRISAAHPGAPPRRLKNADAVGPSANQPTRSSLKVGREPS